MRIKDNSQVQKTLAAGFPEGYFRRDDISAAFIQEFPMRTVWHGLVVCGLFCAVSDWLQAGDSAETKTLLEKAIKAVGGQAKVEQLKNLTWKGKFSIEENGQQIAVNLDGSLQGWDRQRLDLEVNANGQTENIVLVINGKKGWIKVRNNITDIGKELSVFTQVVFAVRGPQLLAGLKDKTFQLSHLGEIKIGDQEAVGLRISRKGAPDLNVFFSKKTYLPLKADTRITEPQGKEIDMEILFGDSKDFGGLKHFTKLTFKADGKVVTMELSDLRPGAQLEANIFNRPE